MTTFIKLLKKQDETITKKYLAPFLNMMSA